MRGVERRIGAEEVGGNEKAMVTGEKENSEKAVLRNDGRLLVSE